MKPLFIYVEESMGAPLKMRTPARFHSDPLANKEPDTISGAQFEKRMVEIREWLLDYLGAAKKKAGIRFNLQLGVEPDENGWVMFYWWALDEDNDLLYTSDHIRNAAFDDKTAAQERRLEQMGLTLDMDDDEGPALFCDDRHFPTFLEWMSRNIKVKGYKNDYDKVMHDLALDPTPPLKVETLNKAEVDKLEKMGAQIIDDTIKQIKNSMDSIF